MSYYTKNDPDNAYLLGAYIRFGKRVTGGIEFPSMVTLPSGKSARMFTLTAANMKELGYGKGSWDDAGNILYIEENGLILEFLQGFLSIPGNSYRAVLDIHTHYIKKWMNWCGMVCDFRKIRNYYSYVIIDWSGTPTPPPTLSVEDSYLYGLALYQNIRDGDYFIITTNKYRGKRRRTPLRLRFNGIPQREPFLIGYQGFNYDKYKRFHP